MPDVARRAHRRMQGSSSLPVAPHPLATFATEVARVQATGVATPEVSHYPALAKLLTALGKAVTPHLAPVSQLSDPGQRSGGFPDFGLLEVRSNVLVAPVEVKGLEAPLTNIATSEQAKKYAREFGGGLTLVTNLWQWSLARIRDDGTIAEDATMRVNLAPSRLDFAAGRLNDPDDTWRDLVYLAGAASRERGNLTSPQQVASLLAYHATKMRDAVNAAGDPDVLFASLKKALRDGLQIDLHGEHLPPTVVQTLVYGTFAAWVETEDPAAFEWMQTSFKTAVPVFAEILHEALRPSLLRHCDLIPHLNNVERVLRWTDRDRFTTAFDGAAIQYFYEPFLAAFDPTLRDDLGIWYTPREVADYQVARVHHHLVNDLNITDGLADPGVYVLDPATGTGTYLIAACDFIYSLHVNNGEPASVAAARTLDAITSRLVGFEILPAAFIICHLHLARHMAALGAPVGERRIRVYLTNSLTGWRPEDVNVGTTLFPELEDELADAATAKQSDPVIVVLGNPPYHGFSSAETDEERTMMADWSAATSQVWKLRKHRMNDLYVRFWRIAIHRIVNISNQGVVSFITNRKWLGGRSYPAMRDTLVNEFTSIWVDDLHGGTHDRSSAVDQSIFTTSFADGIQVGTAIVTAIRTGPAATPAIVRVASYRETAVTKRAALSARSGAMDSTEYRKVIANSSTRYRFVPDAAEDFPVLSEYLPTFHSGVQLVRDEPFTARDTASLTLRMQAYFNTAAWEQIQADHPVFANARPEHKDRRSALQPLGFDAARVQPLTFKPMDTRVLYWETRQKVLHRDRPDLYPYWSSVPGQVSLVAAQTPRRVSGVRPFPSRAVASFAAADPDARVFPLYGPNTLDDNADTERLFETSATGAATATMVAPEWVKAAANALGCDDKTAGEAVFYALVAVTASPAWAESQPVESDDFATVPVPSDPKQLANAAAIGRELTELFDPTSSVAGVTTGSIRPELRDIAVPTVAHGTVPLDGAYGNRGGTYDGADVIWSGDGRWTNVAPLVWGFSVGGFQVLPKWLSYRVRDGLSPTDRDAFRLLCRRIAAIRALERRCDALFADAAASPLSA